MGSLDPYPGVQKWPTKHRKKVKSFHFLKWWMFSLLKSLPVAGTSVNYNFWSNKFFICIFFFFSFWSTKSWIRSVSGSGFTWKALHLSTVSVFLCKSFHPDSEAQNALFCVSIVKSLWFLVWLLTLQNCLRKQMCFLQLARKTPKKTFLRMFTRMRNLIQLLSWIRFLIKICDSLTDRCFCTSIYHVICNLNSHSCGMNCLFGGAHRSSSSQLFRKKSSKNFTIWRMGSVRPEKFCGSGSGQIGINCQIGPIFFLLCALKMIQLFTRRQCSESVSFWYGSESLDPYTRIRILVFSSVFQDANKK